MGDDLDEYIEIPPLISEVIIPPCYAKPVDTFYKPFKKKSIEIEKPTPNKGKLSKGDSLNDPIDANKVEEDNGLNQAFEKISINSDGNTNQDSGSLKDSSKKNEKDLKDESISEFPSWYPVIFLPQEIELLEELGKQFPKIARAYLFNGECDIDEFESTDYIVFCIDETQHHKNIQDFLNCISLLELFQIKFEFWGIIIASRHYNSYFLKAFSLSVSACKRVLTKAGYSPDLIDHRACFNILLIMFFGSIPLTGFKNKRIDDLLCKKKDLTPGTELRPFIVSYLMDAEALEYPELFNPVKEQVESWLLVVVPKSRRFLKSLENANSYSDLNFLVLKYLSYDFVVTDEFLSDLNKLSG